MVEHLTGHSREQLEWAIEQLVQVRRQYKDLKDGPVTSTLDADRRAVLMDSLLYAFKGFLPFYLPEKDGPEISYRRYDTTWTIPYYTMSFDARTFTTSNTLGNISTMWMEHPSDFIEVVKNGIDNNTKEEREQRHNQLREEVEALIDQFKTIIVTDEFL